MTDRSTIYLDHNATTAVCPEAVDAMMPFLREHYGNPSSIHAAGTRVRRAIDDSREQLAATLGVRSAELTWTSGATESINWALRGVHAARRGRNRIVTSAVEHTATLDVCRRLERQGVEVVYLPVDSRGELGPEIVEEALNDDVALISLLWVNNETGVFFDIERIGTLARDRGIPFHVDAVQYAGKGLPKLSGIPVDFVSLSGHKFGAPKGVGTLYVRRGAQIRPLIWGGHHETGRRGGTENVTGIVAMGPALAASEARWADDCDVVSARRDRLEAAIVDRVPGAIVNGADASRIGNTLNVCFERIEGAAVVLTLSAHGIYCSSGSACTASDEGPSHVLQAMGVANHLIHGSVRFSLSTSTSDADIDRAVERIVESVEHVSRVNTI